MENKDKILEEIRDTVRGVFSRKFLDAAPEGQWLSASKEIIQISKMTNGHLRNCINMLQRKELTEHQKYGELMREAEGRGWKEVHKTGDFRLDGAL